MGAHLFRTHAEYGHHPVFREVDPDTSGRHGPLPYPPKISPVTVRMPSYPALAQCPPGYSCVSGGLVRTKAERDPVDIVPLFTGLPQRTLRSATYRGHDKPDREAS
ncbi:hypothetical protein GCM10010441_41170 [Kitasatospora paracochleata]